MKHQNETARDFWAQIFARAAADPNATMHKPDEEGEAAQRELTIKALRDAGWPAAQIERHTDSEGLYRELEIVNSPGVGPGLE